MITRRKFVSLAYGGALASIFAGFPIPARAQASRNVARLLVGFGAGGAIDVIARMLVETMKDYSISFIVDNRPGGGGRVALGALKVGPADGTVDDPDTGVRHHDIPSRLQDALLRCFQGLRPSQHRLLLSLSDHGRTNGAARREDACRFHQLVRAHPKLATYGTAAAGSMLHFTGVTLAKAGDFQFVHLPYGGPAGIQDLIGGRIAATIYPIGTALPHVQSGVIRALATTGPQRSPVLPNVPTVRDAGYPALEATEWFGAFVPANTPPETVNRLNGSIRTAVGTDAFRAGVAKLSVDAMTLKRRRILRS